MTTPPIRILFICNQNSCRSPTAEWLFAKNSELAVQSCGINADCHNLLDEDLLLWADAVISFDDAQVRYIKQHWPQLYHQTRIECLHIPDEFNYKDPQLIQLITKKTKGLLDTPIRKA